MNVNPGELNKRLAIYQASGGTNANGFPHPPTTLVWEGWCKFTRTSGGEAVKANADFADIKARFLIRYPSVTIDRKMIVRYAGNDYDISYINDYSDAHEYMEIWCDLSTAKAVI